MTTRKIVPGPGKYEYSKDKISKSPPKFGFGTESRGNSKKSGIPGPGSYHIPCKVVDVPRYLQTKQAEEFRFI